jgi:NADH:ubiquinone oxidoreductase subunit E
MGGIGFMDDEPKVITRNKLVALFFKAVKQHGWNRRTLRALAQELKMSRSEVKKVLEAYPSVFKSVDGCKGKMWECKQVNEQVS